MAENRLDVLPKPAALLKVFVSASVAFACIKDAFLADQKKFELDISSIDSVSLSQLQSVEDLAAITLRKLQSLRWNAQVETHTTNGIVVGLCSDIELAVERLIAAVSWSQNDPLDSRVDRSVQEWIDALQAAREEINECMFVVGELSDRLVLLEGVEYSED